MTAKPKAKKNAEDCKQNEIIANSLVKSKFLKQLFPIILAVLSGILISWSFVTVSWVLIWICYIPLIFALDRINTKKAIILGFIFGITTFGISYSFIPLAIFTYSGEINQAGVLVIIFGALFFSLFYAIACGLYSFIITHKNYKAIWWKNALLFSSIILLVEAARMFWFPGFSLLAFQSGYSLASSLFAIQPVAVFGYSIMSFAIIIGNLLLAKAISKKSLRHLVYSFVFIGVYFLSGYIIFEFFQSNNSRKNTQEVVLATHNFGSNLVWDETNGDSLAAIIINLNKQAVALNPKIILWTETTIPWTIDENDELLLKMGSQIAGKNTEMIIGTYFAMPDKRIYNTALIVNPDGNSQTYFKQNLLSIIEKPIGSKAIKFLLPFVASNSELSEGENQQPLTTSIGKAGMMICNEAGLPCYDLTKQGSRFLINIGNDSWFPNTWVSKGHYYICRIRAVENRKDLIVHLNGGYSGLIEASGLPQNMGFNSTKGLKQVQVSPNRKNNAFTVLAGTPLLFSLLWLLWICASMIFKRN
ncbi:MAG: apolipoprotein N-acyltransferase [Bacteroidetes bacterium]|nr:MAG: apolipoprotein N-acyltransferase [Bacteroidota bacterium]